MNIGIVTGEESGIFVVDVDGAEGEQSVARLLTRYGALPETLTVQTGRGRHLYFRHPGRRVKSTAGVLGPHLDVRGDGSYIIAPPSSHVSGAEYRFVDEAVEITEAPDWLIALVCGDAQVEQPPAEPENNAIIEGSRNQTLFEHGCGMRGGGASEGEIESELMKINEEVCRPPLELAEVKQIAASAAKYRLGLGKTPPAITGDNNSLRWFPFDTTAWRRNHNVFAMRDSQVGWYIWLTVEAWDRGGSLPYDPALLPKLARASSAKQFYKDCQIVLAEFELTEDKSELVHRGLRAEYLQRVQKVQKKREAGQKRWEKTNAEPVPEGELGAPITQENIHDKN